MRKFSPEERGIFSYFNPDVLGCDKDGNLINDGMVYADPFVIHAQWEAAKINQKTDVEADFDFLGKEAEGYDPASGESDPLEPFKEKVLRRLLPFFHEVFGTKSVAPDGTGITFEEAYNNIINFMNFGVEVKKNTDDPLNLPISSPELMEKSPNGKNTSDSISTKIESSPSVPIP